MPTPNRPTAPDTDEGATVPTGPVRIQPRKMVVSGPAKRGAASKQPAAPPARPAASPGGPGGPGDFSLVAPPSGVPPEPREGLSVRRLLLDAAAVLATLGVVVLVGSFIATPPAEEASPTPTGSVAVASPSPEPTATAAASPTAAASGSAAPPTEAPSAGPAAGLGDRCDDLPECFRYTVQEGDTIASVGALLGVTRTGIVALNPELTPESALEPGSEIRVPTPTR